MADGNSKKKRRERHAGRLRGSEIKTGNSGGRKARLSVLDKALFTRSLDAKAAAMKARSAKKVGA